MTTWAVIATGQSLSPDPLAVVERVRHLPCVAVNDAFRIAPWAKALVACDAAWWNKTEGAKQFAGEKVCASKAPGVIKLPARQGIGTGTNSGLLGLDYAIRAGATRVLLLGIDMQGTHYFGPHKELKNTEPGRFAIFIQQFVTYAKHVSGIDVINCSPISALTCFPKMTLDDALSEQMAA